MVGTTGVVSRFRDLPIPQKIRYAIAGTTLITLLLVIVSFSLFEWYTTRSQIRQDLEVRARIIALNSTAALAFSDPVAAAETLGALRAATDVQLGCIYLYSESEQSLFASYVAGDTKASCPKRPAKVGAESHANSIGLTEAIALEGEDLGLLFIQADLSDLWKRLTAVGQVSLVVLVAALGFAFLLANLMQRLISGPLLSLASVADSVSNSKDYSLRAEKTGRDEVGQLIDSFNDMLVQIDERDSQLREARDSLSHQVEESRRANAELSKTMEQLKETQNQLVQTEKMASLGGLVAGVAHEINTPVGVGVTAASGLKAKTEELVAEYEAGKIKRSTLEEYTEFAITSSAMILRNLERAAELIKSFKQVAVDQSSSEQRSFNLHEYIDEVLLSLRPKLKKTSHTVEIDCPMGLELNTVPGAVSQVLTNLIMNSLIHAFDEHDSGKITITARQRDDWVDIEYTDDGKGIPAEHQDRVFDPFFTTARGAGGSGLGMHIVFNLVTSKLGGKIKLVKDVEKGVKFEISIPVNR